MVRGRSPKARRLQASRTSDTGNAAAACRVELSPAPTSNRRGRCVSSFVRATEVSIVRHPFATPVLAIALAACIASPAYAGDIHITGGNCAAVVHLVAHDAPLSDVLRRLAQTLGFQLADGGASDTPVNVDVSRRPADLIASLAGSENVSMTMEANPRCPRRERIVKLWVLPGKQGAPAHTKQNAAQAEQARREQEGIDMVLRAHGMPTSKSPAVKPR